MSSLHLSNIWLAFATTLLAGLATVLGSVLVFTKKTPGPRLLSFGLAFAGGAMVYVSLSEILNKSIASFTEVWGKQYGFAWGTLSFLAGVIFIALVDRFVPNPHDTLSSEDRDLQQHERSYIKRLGLMTAAAITIHNFPEGLASFFAMLESPSIGAPLAVAIAVHNIPEGIAIAIPVYFATGSKAKAVWLSLLSGLAEPLGAAIGYGILAPFLSPSLFGVVFGMIAGVMVFLSLDELLPAAKKYAEGHETVYGLVSGMAALAISLVLFKF